MRSCLLGHARSTGRLACLMVLATALLGCLLPQVASAEDFALSKVAEPSSVCPEGGEGHAECLAIRVPTVPASSADAAGPDLEGSGEKGGLDPKDLREAYKLPETGGSSQTVALIDAFNDPYAESDLQKYREKYKVYFKGTETACTQTNGCFKKVNQIGETQNYPENNEGWSGEISLDVDMVSAACPECHILLVEANNEELSSLFAANEEAAKLKATEISNSWGEVEFSGETSDDKYFDHPGIPTFAAAGDVEYDGCDHKLGAGICYPAASQYVISVGGTKLKKESESSRKWTEEVWKEESRSRGTGSGCSKYEPKTPGQKELPTKNSYCEHRLDNDVAADASVESAVSVYDTYYGGWEDFGGTSASSPFVAGVEAHATSATQLLGADAFYKKASMLFDVTKGNNGKCTPPVEDEYFCTAEVGYDGPTGEGTPDNVFASVVPAGATGFATKVESKGATLNGIVNPNGATTKYYFEYGTTESYGTKTAEVSVGSGTSNLEESKAVTSLAGSTKYYFRIVTTNSNGTTYGLTQVFSTLPNAPENTAPPVTSPETPDQAVPESTTTGRWTNSPTGYEYQWERCNATGGECASISGATSSKYTPVEADVGHTLVVKVTAKNSGGSNSAHSKATNTVKPIGQITEYPLPPESYPNAITTGPDGNLWFLDEGSKKIGKITTAGVVTEYPLPKESYLEEITAGPDGNVWFTSLNKKIGKVTPAGKITEYPVSPEPIGITAGPDGNLWFTGSEKIGKITTSGEVTEYKLPKAGYPEEITAGPDGNLWFTYYSNESSKARLGKITTSGEVTEYTLPGERYATSITAGPGKENALWFTREGIGNQSNAVGKITTSGTVTEYSLPENSQPQGITAGPDGNVWFTERGRNKIGRITTSGSITEYSLPSGSFLEKITAGPDDNLWFAGANWIGKITP